MTKQTSKSTSISSNVFYLLFRASVHIGSPLQGAEKKSGVPYILMSEVGIAKRPIENMMRRHATWKYPT